MDKRVLIILVVVILVVAGIGGALFFFSRQQAATVIPTPQPSSSPAATTTQTQPALTASAATPLVSGQAGTIDIYLNTKSVKIDGFQFIATVGGTALPAIPDGDPATDGTQIVAATIPELSVSTNSVTDQDGTSVVRFAMIAQDTANGFTSSAPVKVASIPVSSGTGGTISLAFNQQNSRVRLTTGGDDSLLAVIDASIPVSGSVAANSSSSAALVSSVTSTPIPQATTTTAAATSASPFCLASCFTDSDCAAGLVCETDRCVNPACPTSQTCGCGANTTATPVPTSKAVSASTSATPRATVKPTATPKETMIAEASSSATLPSSGSFEYTLLTIGAGMLLIGGGIFLTAKQEA